MSPEVSASTGLYNLLLEENIAACAVITPLGIGGVSVIRVSGPRSFELTKKLCSFLPVAPESHRIYYGTAKDSSGEILDEVLVAYFARGKSFTGEETTEISCHGSPVSCDRILKSLISVGVRGARPGEFTCRAFLNGRIDLVQAEGVLSVIESQSGIASRMALRQLEGELSNEYKKIEDHVVWALAQIEASIDFSTEGLEIVSSEILAARIMAAREISLKLLETYRVGRILREGFSVSILGKPNVGKSSLLNTLLGESRAIVTEEAGTTRDPIQARLRLNGRDIELVDTAGLRRTQNVVEKIGIAKSFKKAAEGDLVIYVIDSVVGRDDEDDRLISEIQNSEILICYNKSDLVLEQGFSEGLHVSARTGHGLDDLRARIVDRMKALGSDQQILVSQARHFEQLTVVEKSLAQGLERLAEDASYEFVAQDLEAAVRGIHELLGVVYDEQVIDRIFKEFCLGK